MAKGFEVCAPPTAKSTRTYSFFEFKTKVFIFTKVAHPDNRCTFPTVYLSNDNWSFDLKRPRDKVNLFCTQVDPRGVPGASVCRNFPYCTPAFPFASICPQCDSTECCCEACGIWNRSTSFERCAADWEQNCKFHVQKFWDKSAQTWVPMNIPVWLHDRAGKQADPLLASKRKRTARNTKKYPGSFICSKIYMFHLFSERRVYFQYIQGRVVFCH